SKFTVQNEHQAPDAGPHKNSSPRDLKFSIRLPQFVCFNESTIRNSEMGRRIRAGELEKFNCRRARTSALRAIGAWVYCLAVTFDREHLARDAASLAARGAYLRARVAQ